MAVVVAGELGQDRAEMPCAEDEDVIQALAAERAHEPLRKRVRSRRSDRRLDHPRAVAGEDAVECGGELAVPVADEEFEPSSSLTEIYQQMRACCVVQAGAGCAVTPRICTAWVWIS